MKTSDPQYASKLKEAVAAALSQTDFRRQLKSFGLLALCAFGLFFLVVAPLQLFEVHAVNGWRPQPARLISVSQERSAFRSAVRYWRYVIELAETGERVITSDVRPGDLPMSVLGWSSSDTDARRYRNGQDLTVFRSPEGGKVYLERGSFGFMSVVFAAALAFWSVMITRIVRHRRNVASRV